MFKFLKENEDGPPNGAATSPQNLCPCSPSHEPNPETGKFQNHHITDYHYRIAIQAQSSAYEGLEDEKKLKYIMVNELLRSPFATTDPTVRKILESTSDLLPGIYEGGFKIWECTFDLIKHLERNSAKYSLDSRSKVLDLGCGSGLLGLLALSYGAEVDFHDFNSEVLNFLTIPNVILNQTDEGVVRCRFLSGNWESFLNHIAESPDTMEDYQYDFILSSETVYNLDYLPAFYSIIKACLKPSGIMLLAAKTCYFGVGGGTKTFLRLVEEDGAFDAVVLEVFRTGVQRELIALTWKSSKL